MRTVTTELLTEMSQQQYTPYVRINLWDTNPNEQQLGLLAAVTAVDSNGYDIIELWSVLDGVKTKLWEFSYYPATGVAVDSIYWSTTQNKLFIACFRWWDDYRLILSWVPGDPAPEIFKSPFAGINDMDPCSAMIDFNGKFYAIYSGQDNEPAWLARMDPADPDGTYEVVLQADHFEYDMSEGGLGIIGDKLYAVFNEVVYWSTTGDLGDWTLIDLWASDRITAIAGAKLDPHTGNIYFVALRDGPPHGTTFREIWRIDSSGPAVEFSQELLTPYYDWDDFMFAALGMVSGQQPVAIQWISWGSDGPSPPWTLDIYRRQSNGTWVKEEAADLKNVLSPSDRRDPIVLVNQAAVYYQGKLHLATDTSWWEYDDETHTTFTEHDVFTLFRRDSIGSWSVVTEWEPIGFNNMFHYGGIALCVVGG
jgi:hypothetical protein